VRSAALGRFRKRHDCARCEKDLAVRPSAVREAIKGEISRARQARTRSAAASGFRRRRSPAIHVGVATRRRTGNQPKFIMDVGVGGSVDSSLTTVRSRCSGISRNSAQRGEAKYISSDRQRRRREIADQSLRSRVRTLRKNSRTQTRRRRSPPAERWRNLRPCARSITIAFQR